jgi:hypothetical protein
MPITLKFRIRLASARPLWVGFLICGVFQQRHSEHGVGWLGTVDTWITYRISKNVRLDGGVYLGVTPAADAWHPWIGMTWQY